MKQIPPLVGLMENIQNLLASIYFIDDCMKNSDSEERI